MCTKSYRKICKKCGSCTVKKNGHKNNKQRYKCNTCGHVFQNSSRRKNNIVKELWNQYCFGKQTYAELSQQYSMSMKKIQALLDEYEFIPPQITPSSIVLLMDTTYFWDIWLMVFKDCKSKKIINFKLVINENNHAYKTWVKELQDQWWDIKAIVCDGRRWLLTGFPNIPTQMCQFHQVAILRRYITKKPILDANKDLKWIWELLIHTDRESFEYELEKYYQRYENFLKERRVNSKWKYEYIHTRTRSAYFSLKRNLKYLFTWYDYYWTIDIPNTTNWLEWVFGHLKIKVSLHRWLKRQRKIKLILCLLHWKN